MKSKSGSQNEWGASFARKLCAKSMQGGDNKKRKKKKTAQMKSNENCQGQIYTISMCPDE